MECNSPMCGKNLNLKRMALNEYLDHLEGQGYLTVNRTAGLDMVYLKRKSGLRKLFPIIIKNTRRSFKG